VILVILLIVLGMPVWSAAQTYSTLMITQPIATGVAGTGLDANHRVFRQYTGIPYNIRATGKGGKYPYTWTFVSGAPSGMTIENGPCTANGKLCTAGTINWPNPLTGTYSNITIRLTDALGNTVDAVWTLVVSTTACSNAGGFCFVDAVNGNDANNGDIGTPFQTPTGLKAVRTGHQIVYFRTGTYTLNQATSVWTFREDVSGPVIWICYPGETCTIDWQSTGGPEVTMLEYNGKNVYMDSFQYARVGSMGIRYVNNNRYGPTFRRNIGLQLVDGENGMNSAYYMWVNANPGFPSYWGTVQNNSLGNLSGDGGIDNGDGGSTQDMACIVKLYNAKGTIIEDNDFFNSPFAEGIIAPKEETPDTTIRNNKISGQDVLYFVFGNFNNQGGLYEKSSGEILHNLCIAASGGACLDITETHIGDIGVYEIYRNTFIGKVIAAGAAPAADHLTSADGPFHYNNNVIATNSYTGGSCPTRLTCLNVDDYTVLDMQANNLQSDNDGTYVNPVTGLLVNRSLVGTKGFELGSPPADSGLIPICSGSGAFLGGLGRCRGTGVY